MPASRNPLFASILAVFAGVSILFLFPTASRATSSVWATNPQSRVRLLSPYQMAPRTGELRLGVHFTLAPGWHVYWKNSGDAGYPPTVEFAKNPALSGAELLWPAPHRFELPGDLVAFGYEDEVVYPVRATVQADPAAERLEITADVDYVICESECIPYRYLLKLVQPLGDRPVADPATAPLVETWWGHLPAPVDRLSGVETQGFLEQGAGGPALEVRVSGAQGEPGSVDLFLEPQDVFETEKPQARKEGDALVFRVPLQPKVAGQALPAKTPLAWTVTGLRHEGRPVSLEARREVELRTASAAKAETEAQPPGSTARRGGQLQKPAITALLAVVSTLLALGLWGLLPLPLAPQQSPLREALGFVAAAGTLGLLYALSRQISNEGLAWIELSLLGMSLFAWLRHKAATQTTLKFALALCLVACAVLALWLADRNRLYL